MKINVFTLAIFAVAAAIAVPHLHHAFWTPARIAGAVLASVSFVVIVIARFQLGAAFSVRAKARTLVKTGLYARIRNPIYVFGELFVVGIALLTGRWIFLLIGAALVPVQMRRARNEARVLREAFGDEYERYHEQTWF